MKKLLCMALAIMLLVSAVPVFAAADDAKVIVFTGADDSVGTEIGRTGGETIGQLIEYLYAGWSENYEISNARIWPDGGTKFDTTDATQVVGANDSARIRVVAKVQPDDKDDEKQDDEKQDDNKVVAPTTISVTIKVDNSDNVVKGPFDLEPADGESAVVENILKHYFSKTWENDYTFDHAYSRAVGSNVARTASVNVGDTIFIMLKTKSNTTVTPPSETTMYDIVFLDADKDISTKVSVQKGSYVSVADIEEAADKVGTKSGYYFTGKWKAGNTGDALSADTISQLAVNKDITYYPEWAPLTTPGTVYLHVFLNEDARHVYKTYDITSGIAKDGLLSLDDDVKTFLKQYYTAKDSDGITYEGLYFATGDFEGSYRNGEYQKVIDNVKQLQVKGAVHVNVMLKNAKLKSTSSSTADSSNPKTGDTIFAPIMVMGLTGTALAAAYVVGKKRFAR